MKGIVFSFKKHELSKSGYSKRLTLSGIFYLFKRYGIRIMFISVFLIGLTAGSFYADNSDKAMLNSLDFLFTTNLDVRLAQNAVGTFCACFASDFIFIFSVFLLGLAPWGIPVMPFVIMFKGFGTGLTAGYLFITYSLKGVGFYLIVLLPGTFLFCLALVVLSSAAFISSKRMFFNVISSSVPKSPLRYSIIDFCSRSISALIMTFCSALLDAVLWTLFAGIFNF